MQEQYISLNPANAATEEKSLRAKLYEQRFIEAQGGQAAMTLGTQWGLTAAVLTYSRVSHQGWTFMPIQLSKAQGYAKIGVAFLGFYTLGHSFVMAKFGNKAQFDHRYWNKKAILAGTTSWDPKESSE